MPPDPSHPGQCEPALSYGGPTSPSSQPPLPSLHTMASMSQGQLRPLQLPPNVQTLLWPPKPGPPGLYLTCSLDAENAVITTVLWPHHIFCQHHGCPQGCHLHPVAHTSCSQCPTETEKLPFFAMWGFRMSHPKMCLGGTCIVLS